MSGKRTGWLPHEGYALEPGLIDETLYALCRAYLDDSDKQWPEEWLPILAHRFCDYLDEIKASGRQQAGGRPGIAAHMANLLTIQGLTPDQAIEKAAEITDSDTDNVKRAYRRLVKKR